MYDKKNVFLKNNYWHAEILQKFPVSLKLVKASFLLGKSCILAFLTSEKAPQHMCGRKVPFPYILPPDALSLDFSKASSS